jgi:hypothetical protein
MPGTTRLEFYQMSLADALAVIAADETALLAQMGDAADVAELQRAARSIVGTHAEAVAERYTKSPLAPFLKLISN